MLEQRILKRAPPPWMQFLVNAATGQVVTPVLFFLMNVRARRGSGSKDTMEAYAYDMQSWFNFLAEEEIAWTAVEQPQLDDWIDDMADGGLARSTIRRRAETIRVFYNFVARRGGPSIVLSTARTNMVTACGDVAIRPMLPADIKRLLEHLERAKDPLERFRNRRLTLAVLLAFYSGLRRMEIVGLDAAQFSELHPDPEQPMAEQQVTLRITKGGRPRVIRVPNHLVIKLQAFIADDRATAVAVAGSDTPALFVNAPGAPGGGGRRMSRATLSRDFRLAVDACGLTRPNVGHLVGTGRSGRRHTFHDLRHSCACAYFVAASGTSADPWFDVQLRLGHECAQTTRKVYLAYVDHFTRASPQALVAEMLA